ncbi:MAG TPA: FAD-dependent oxidoreductase [Aquabacterium sp.]|uniref:flavin monoamine oxidase family protein n=1 Tax=Aquabacterium sp. TaxID=1872578 RepID=UPI002E3450BC|nr:FAD-dependent oxidoreductase [Aquabacterium sp.]HEX5356216.1 FAD-dependent oxidoreductase [Aquabacterium sp.]
MIDVAIVGAGLTGLTLARQLLARGLSVAVFDARTRAGGRILSDVDPAGGATVDLGASWYWPDTEPRITALIESLGLRSFDQPDSGQVLSLPDASRAPEPMDVNGIHGGARRLSGGMGQLVQALVAQLPAGSLQLGHRVLSLIDCGTHIELHVSVDLNDSPDVIQAKRFQAKRVVLALPPRLMLQSIRFQPELPEATVEAMSQVSTWMAREAKSFMRYNKPFWLEAGHSGSAFVTHIQAVLREIWDASDEHGAALAGFHAIPPDARPHFERSMPMLVASQFGQLFGPEAQGDTVVTKDWAQDAWTCSELDRQDPSTFPPQASPILRRPHWGSRLFFGGTETARQAAGHMEGALESVARLSDFLRPVRQSTVQPAQHLEEALSRFHQWVEAERQQALPRYRQHVNQMLSRQDRDRVTQRAVLATVEQTYSRALEQLSSLDMFATDLGPSGQTELTPKVLKAFSGFSKSFVDDALAFNAGSCALSNFQSEHRPDSDYLRAITADLAAAWVEFAWSTNDLLNTQSIQPH